jgi:hypothetical protein
MTADSHYWAREYHRCGWRVVPIPAGRKAPVVREWQHFEATVEDLPRLFGGGQNIGVILDHDLADVDIDCPEGVALADLYLPATRAIFGRPSKPRSHRVFLAPTRFTRALSIPSPATRCSSLGPAAAIKRYSRHRLRAVNGANGAAMLSRRG